MRTGSIELHLSVEPELTESLGECLVLLPDRDFDLVAAAMVAVERSWLPVASRHEERRAGQERREVVRVMRLPDLLVALRIAPQRPRIFTLRRDQVQIALSMIIRQPRVHDTAEGCCHPEQPRVACRVTERTETTHGKAGNSSLVAGPVLLGQQWTELSEME